MQILRHAHAISLFHKKIFCDSYTRFRVHKPSASNLHISAVRGTKMSLLLQAVKIILQIYTACSLPFPAKVCGEPIQQNCRPYCMSDLKIKKTKPTHMRFKGWVLLSNQRGQQPQLSAFKGNFVARKKVQMTPETGDKERGKPSLCLARTLNSSVIIYHVIIGFTTGDCKGSLFTVKMKARPWKITEMWE